MSAQFEENRTIVRDSLTPPKNGRSTDMFFDNQALTEEQKTQLGQNESLQMMKRESTKVGGELGSPALNDVLSISTKHRPSIT